MLPRSGAPSRAIVIGGGVAGVSIARELARKGVGVTLLEKAGQLCAGATWHAAGLVTRFGGSPKIKKVHVRALREMTALHEAHDIGLHITGSIRLIEKGNPDRLTEAKQHVAMAALYDDPGLPTTLITPKEVAALHPLVDTSGVEAGVFTPRDGDVDPTLLTTCIAGLAKADGAEFVHNAEVETIERRSNGTFEVRTGAGAVFEADAVVNAAGLWSRRFSRQLGLEQTHPAFVIEHQYAITETIPALKGKVGDGERVPVLRDLAGSSYIRQERDGLLVGPYEGLLSPGEQTKVRTEWAEGPPSHFAFDLFPPALDRLEGCLLSAMSVVPALGEVGFKSIVNGPTIWTGDSLARCGRTRLPGYYDFNSLTYGVAQSLALAEYLGHIITEGEQPYDMATEFDPLRYGGWATPEYTAAKVLETYSHNNAISYPHESRPAGRDAVAKSDAHRALQATLAAHGAVFSFSNAGVEVPLVFLPGGAGAAPLDLKTFASHAWAPFAEEEAQHLLRAVGLGFASFSKLRVRSGASDAASRLLERVTTNSLPKRAGRTRLTYAPTSAGNILAEFTVTRTGNDGDGSHDFYLCASRDYAQHDLAWLEQQRALLEEAGLIEAGAVELVDCTDEVEILHVAGPSAQALMHALCPEAASVPFLQMRNLRVCGVAAAVFRISFTGEAGYELHVSAEDAAPLFDQIMRSDKARALRCRPFGSAAVNALRVEKGFKVKADLDFAHWSEAGVDAFIPDARKHEVLPFLGKDAPAPLGSEQGGRLAAIFDVATDEAHAWSVIGDSPIRDATGRVVGFTTTSARGAITGRTIALGYVKRGESGAPLAFAGDGGLTLESLGQIWPVELLSRPPVEVGGKPRPAEAEPIAASG